MKKIYTIIICSIILLSSCENKQKIKDQLDISISHLEQERNSVSQEIYSINSEISSKRDELTKLNEQLKEAHILTSGKTPKYILKIHLKQSHFSLSIAKHVKDAMNAIDFELPVDKDFYNSVTEGTKIQDRFRWGSLILSGSLGDWNMTVKGKEIR